MAVASPIARSTSEDVLPINDYGVRNGFAVTYAWKQFPAPEELLEFGERWRPHRNTAAWYFWCARELPVQNGSKKAGCALL